MTTATAYAPFDAHAAIRRLPVLPAAGLGLAVIALLVAWVMLAQMLIAPMPTVAATSSSPAQTAASPVHTLTHGVRTFDILAPASGLVTYEFAVIEGGSLLADVRDGDAHILASVPGGQVFGPGAFVSLDVPADAGTLMVSVRSTTAEAQPITLTLQMASSRG